MSRKLSVTMIFVLLVSLFLTSPVLAAKTYHAERFDVQIDLEGNGSAVITETVEFRFDGDPFTFAFREISATETDGITFLEASMDGVPMAQGTEAGQVEVRAGDPLKVTWYFAPTSDTTHVFTVRYRADGVIRKGDGDTLIWRAIPEEHDYTIAHSTVTLTYPPQAAVLEQPTLTRNFDSAWEGDRIILTASDIPEDQDLILTARFAPDSLAQVAPQCQVQQESAAAATARALPAGFLAGLATLLLGGLGLLTYIRANGRDLNLSAVIPTPNPPSDIPPALIGRLTKQQHNFIGTIFDLAQRGVLEVREEKGFLGTNNHILSRRDHAVPLQPHEQGLMDALFKPGESQIKMSEIATRLATKQTLFDEPLEQELIQRGWLDPERKQRRTVLSTVGFLGMIIAIITFILSVVIIGINLSTNAAWIPLVAAVAGISAGLFLLSIALLIYAAAFSILTPAGEEQVVRWKGFAEYLKQVSKGREPAIRPDYFERYLAYAAAFGLGANWAKYFQSFGGVPLPVWFHATAGSHGNFGAMVALMSASDSTGSGGGAGGGGAGASGGGSSGAG
jgi:uncharacterized protein (TIGR04222 family)